MALTKIHKLILQSAGLGAVGPATGASCSIFIAGTGTLAQTYSDRNGATLTANPVIVGADGYVSVYVESGAYDMTVVSGASTTSVADILAVDDIIISGPQGEPQFATVAAMIAGTPLNQKPGAFNWSNYVGRTVKTVVNNSTSNEGGAEYRIWTLSAYRASISNPTWVPDGYVDHYVGSGSTYVAKFEGDDEVNAYQFGCADAGASYSYDSYPAMNSARFRVRSIVIPKTNRGILLLSSHDTGIDQEYTGQGSIREPHIVTKIDFGASACAMNILGTTTAKNINLKGSIGATVPGDQYLPASAGTGLRLRGTTNKQWSSFRDMFISGYNYGIHHDGCYYMEYQNINCHSNNVGLWLDNTTGGAVGSSPVSGGHFRSNRLCGMLIDGHNDYRVTDTVFEFNRTHIIHNSGVSRFDACYLGDGPWQVANVTGGRLILDQSLISTIGSGGNLARGYEGTAGIDKKIDYHCGGIEASGGVVELHNAKLERNIYSNLGVSDGTRDNGSDLRFTGGSKCYFYNSKVESYFPVSYDSDAGSLRNGDTFNNYFINGLFDRPETLAYDIVGASAATIATPASNPFSKNKLELTATGSFSYACRFSVPERFVGAKMAMCLLIGMNNGVSSRIFSKSGFSVTGPNFSETTEPFWAPGGLAAVSMAWYTVTISSTEGFAQLSGTVAGAHTFNMYGFILTEEENFQKLGNYQDAWVRRIATSPPAVGTWRAMDSFVDGAPTAGATRFVCAAGGAPGTWVVG